MLNTCEYTFFDGNHNLSLDALFASLLKQLRISIVIPNLGSAAGGLAELDSVKHNKVVVDVCDTVAEAAEEVQERLGEEDKNSNSSSSSSSSEDEKM